MTNQETDDVGVVNVEEGIANEEEADTRHDVSIANANRPPSSAIAIPWWKQKRTKIITGVILVMLVILAIALGVSLSKSNNNPVDEIELVSPSSSPISNSSSLADRPPADTSSSSTTTISNSELKNLSMTIYGISSIEDTNSWSEITALDIECYFNGCTGEEGDVNKGVWDVSTDLVVVDVVSSDEKRERYLQQDSQAAEYVQVIYNQTSTYTTSDPTLYDDLYVATDPYAQRASQDVYIARLQSLSNFYDNITGIGSVRQIPSDDDGPSISLTPSSSPMITSLTSPPSLITSSPSLPPSISSLTTETFKCFGADDGGLNGVLGNAVRAYVSQDCTNDKECDIGRVYGWPMNSWCVGNVEDMSYLFYEMGTFNEDISGWNTSSVTDMSAMFAGASSFNGDVSNFNTSSVTNMWSMFNWATSFNGDVSNFNTSKVTNMAGMFYYAKVFNRDVSNFDTSSVTNMYYMFNIASAFNGDLSNFNTSSVIWMNGMFQFAESFNQDVSNFDTSRVTDMRGMFDGAISFNGDVSSFNTSSVTDMTYMFSGATSFDQDISNFNISSVTDMRSMFRDASSFNQDLCSWQDSFPYTNFPYTNAADIFTNSGCTYQDTPREDQKGPFCASNCQSSQVV